MDEQACLCRDVPCLQLIGGEDGLLCLLGSARVGCAPAGARLMDTVQANSLSVACPQGMT